MTAPEIDVQRALGSLGPLGAFQKLIAENDALIRCDRWDIGREIVTGRTAIYTGLVHDWAAEQHARFGYDKPFAVVALGGTGRGEMAPYSDTDFAFLFDDNLEGNTFLLELQKQVLHSDFFKNKYGFCCEALPFSLDDAPNLDGKQLNAFIDMRAIHDPSGLVETFRDRIRATYDPFEHFLHVREFWIKQWEEASSSSEDINHFDIKNDGLRVFLAGIWTIGGKEFTHSHEVYQSLEDPRDLEAYDFLLRVRTFVHSRRTPHRAASAGGNHPEDIMSFDDFLSFGKTLGPDADEQVRFEFGNDIRARFLAARRRVSIFAKGVIQRELKLGRSVNPGSSIVYGSDGLYSTTGLKDGDGLERSRNALRLLLASQRYRTPIDPSELLSTFRNAGDWLVRVPELSSLFYEENGSLADTFKYLAQVEGAEDRLFPGYAKFESSLDERVLTERTSLRGKLQRQKIRALETFIDEGRSLMSNPAQASQNQDQKTEVDIRLEAAALESDHVAAIKLALKTKRLPMTDDDRAVRDDQSSSLYDRYSSGFSGMPLADYYRQFVSDCGFPEQTIEMVEFLVANRRAFKMFAKEGITDGRTVDHFASLCGNETRLRALFVFTWADRVEWASESAHPTRWFNIKELYTKTWRRFGPSADPARALAASGYSRDELEILRDFGQDFFAGRYRRYANQFGSRLLQLAEDPESNEPKVALLRDGASVILGVAARDLRGLAATISAVLWKSGIGLRQAHLFSASRHGLALDFFHLTRGEDPFPDDLTKLVEEAIIGRLHVDEADDGQLPPLNGTTTYMEWRPNQYCLRFEGDPGNDGLMYSLTYRMYRYLKADIFALSAHSTGTQSFVSIYHNLPDDLSPEEATKLVAEHF